MSLEEDAQTIREYQEWKITVKDTSPEAFVKWRAKESAWDKLERIIKGLEKLDDKAEVPVGTIRSLIND